MARQLPRLMIAKLAKVKIVKEYGSLSIVRFVLAKEKPANYAKEQE